MVNPVRYIEDLRDELQSRAKMILPTAANEIVHKIKKDFANEIGVIFLPIQTGGSEIGKYLEEVFPDFGMPYYTLYVKRDRERCTITSPTYHEILSASQKLREYKPKTLGLCWDDIYVTGTDLSLLSRYLEENKERIGVDYIKTGAVFTLRKDLPDYSWLYIAHQPNQQPHNPSIPDHQRYCQLPTKRIRKTEVSIA